MTESSGIFVIYLDIRLYSVICNFRKLVFNLPLSKEANLVYPLFVFSFFFFHKKICKKFQVYFGCMLAKWKNSHGILENENTHLDGWIPFSEMPCAIFPPDTRWVSSGIFLKNKKSSYIFMPCKSAIGIFMLIKTMMMFSVVICCLLHEHWSMAFGWEENWTVGKKNFVGEDVHQEIWGIKVMNPKLKMLMNSDLETKGRCTFCPIKIHSTSNMCSTT